MKYPTKYHVVEFILFIIIMFFLWNYAFIKKPSQHIDNATIKKQRIEIGMGFLKEIRGRALVENRSGKIFLVENIHGEKLEENNIIAVGRSSFMMPLRLKAHEVAPKIRRVIFSEDPDFNKAALAYLNQ